MPGAFLKITIRNLYREKMYALINIAGLSLAIACCLILGLYLRSELTYDRHNPKHRQIYRVVNEFNINGKSDSMARTSQLLGPMLKDENGINKITHVFADLPPNSHLKYDVLSTDDIPFFAVPEDINARIYRLAGQINYYTYLIMDEDYDIRDFKDISDSFNKRNMEHFLRGSNVTWKAWLQPLADIHHYSDVDIDEPTGNLTYLYGFTAVAIFIILIACINYMNLATARAAKRAEEIGMQKILGSGRARLIFRFMGEAVFFSIIALIFGYILLEIALTMTPINGLLDNSIALKDLTDPYVLAGMLVFSLVLGLLSGTYPALYLSSIPPLSALTGGQQAGKGSIRLRKSLVLIQFVISVCVIACTLIMAIQMNYVSSKEPGFEKENRLLITLRTADVLDKAQTIKKELLKNGNILGVSVCNNVLGRIGGLNVLMVENNDGTRDRMSTVGIRIGNEFFEVMGIKLKEGRDLSKRLITDVGNSLVVNEAFAKKMGWNEPLGKHIGNGRVIGVVKDFHYDSLHKKVEPFLLRQFPPNTDNIPVNERKYSINYMVLKLSGAEMSETLSFIEEVFAEFDPKHPFEFEFQDDFLSKLYKDEQRQMMLIGIFSAVCIFISCMGLFGLAAFTTEQRTKEIGIRKVLGSSTWQIITMLARNILILVLTGAVIASIIAYYSMSEYWLIDFAYRININMNSWVFLAAAAVAAAVAFVTVALQSFKTAQANPVKALRYE
ncbi:MAG: FtsX-like permease family protein [Desulfobacteraceae bacterium]|jgi:putative ABC transport system permease protein